MSEGDIYGTTLSQESIKVIAETIGIPNLPDEAAKELAEDVSYRLKLIIQVFLSIIIFFFALIFKRGRIGVVNPVTLEYPITSSYLTNHSYLPTYFTSSFFLLSVFSSFFLAFIVGCNSECFNCRMLQNSCSMQKDKNCLHLILMQHWKWKALR